MSAWFRSVSSWPSAASGLLASSVLSAPPVDSPEPSGDSSGVSPEPVGGSPPPHRGCPLASLLRSGPDADASPKNLSV